MLESWYDKSLEQIEHRFSTDRGRGLTRQAVSKARKAHGSNDVYPSKTSSFFAYREQIPTDFASIMLLVAAIVAKIFDFPVAADAMIFMLLLNHAAAIFTFVKAQRVLEGMAGYSLPTAKVMRDGRLTLLDMRSLVPGDVIFLSAGDIVPADCRLFAADGLYINEGTLTGVQNSIRKDAEFTNFAPKLAVTGQLNMAFATTIVTAGTGRAIVVATGERTLAADGGKLKPIVTHENLQVLSKLRGYCRTWSLAMLAMIFAVIVADIIFGHSSDIFTVFLTGLSLAAASMAELFTAFGYIVIGCGIFAAMKRRRDVNVGALIKNTEKLETLRELDTLIIPKDGMITQSHSFAEKIYLPRSLLTATDLDRVDKLRSVVLSGVISTGIYGAGLSSLNQSSRKITADEEALIELASSLGLYNAEIDRKFPIIEHASAGGASKFDTTLTLDSDSRYLAVCRGEAAAILDSCEYYTQRGGIYRMTTDDRLEFLGAAQSLMRSSYKVVALATGSTGHNNLRRIGEIQSDLTFEGFIALREPLQPGVAQTVSRARAAGIKVILTSERLTESEIAIAKSVGIISDEKEILTESRYLSMNRDLLRSYLPIYNMYCGLNSMQIAEIVTLLKADGHKVGLLAGGISGALLLRRADVGFAQAVTISPRAKRGGIDIRSRQTPAYSRISGAGGKTFDSEALKFISDVVISDADRRGDGGFAAVISSLEFARTIYTGLLRVLRYLVTVQSARIFLVLGSSFFGSMTLDAVKICFGGLIVDFAAVLCTAFAKPPHDALTAPVKTEEALAHPLSMNLRPIIFALVQAALMLAVKPISSAVGAPMTSLELATVSFIAFTACQLVTLVEYASERSIFSANLRLNTILVGFIALLGGTIAAGLTLESVGNLLGMVALRPIHAIFAAAVPLFVLAMHEIYKLIAGTASRTPRAKTPKADDSPEKPTKKKRAAFKTLLKGDEDEPAEDSDEA